MTSIHQISHNKEVLKSLFLILNQAISKKRVKMINHRFNRLSVGNEVETKNLTILVFKSPLKTNKMSNLSQTKTKMKTKIPISNYPFS